MQDEHVLAPAQRGQVISACQPRQVETMAGGGVGMIMAFYDFGAWSLVGQRLTEVGINSITAFIAAGWTPKRWPRRGDFALLRGLGPKVVLLRSVTLVIAQTPTVALGFFAEPRAAGLFAFAWRLVEIVRSLIAKPMQGVAQSVIAAMRRLHAATDEFLLDLSNLAAWATFPAFVGLALISDPLIELLLGRDWRAAAPTLSILCIAGAVSALTAVQEAYLLARDRVEAFVRASAFEAAIGIVIVALASAYGPAAAAAAVVARTLALLPLRTTAALTPEGIAPARLVRAIASPLLAAAGMRDASVAQFRSNGFNRRLDCPFLVVGGNDHRHFRLEARALRQSPRCGQLPASFQRLTPHRQLEMKI